MSATDQATETVAWHALSTTDVATRLATDPERGLDADEVERRLAQYGPNELATEPPPSLWVGRPGPAVEPDEHHAADRRRSPASRSARWRRASSCWRLVTFNVVMGSNQELQGAGQRRGAGAAPGAPRPGPAVGQRRGGRLDRARAGRRRAARGRRPRPGRRAASSPRRRSRCRRRRSPARARRSPRTRTTLAGGRRRARRPHEHGVPEHAGHPGLGDRRRDRHRSGDPDGPHRRHGHRDEAHAVAAAAGARRPDQGLRHPRLVGGGGHRHRRHRARPGRPRRSCCCASRPRSRPSRRACRRSCRRCCRRGRSASPSPRRSSSRSPTSRRSAARR